MYRRSTALHNAQHAQVSHDLIVDVKQDEEGQPIYVPEPTKKEKNKLLPGQKLLMQLDKIEKKKMEKEARKAIELDLDMLNRSMSNLMAEF